MLLTLAYKAFDTQMDAFDTIDKKANTLVGYVSVAGALLGLASINNEELARGLTFLAVAFVFFTASVALTLVVQFCRSVKTPPSAKDALAHLEAGGDEQAAREIIQAMQEAHDKLRGTIGTKALWLNFATVLAATGFASLAVAVIQIVMTGAPCSQ